MGKVNQTGDSQSLNTFGLAYAINHAFTRSGTETAQAASSTTIQSTGATAHVADDAKGAMIIANTSATWAGTTIYGVVQSVNVSTGGASTTAPIYNVDRWYLMDGTATVSTPSTTGPFVILPGMAPFWFVALTTSTSGVNAITDTGAALGGTEHSTNGLGRRKITSVTRTAGSNVTYAVTIATTFTYTTSGAVNIGRAALCNSSVLNKDFAYYIDQINSGTAIVVSANGDTVTIQYTITVG